MHLAVAKPGLSTEKASQKPGRETGKQHGLASPRRPFLDPAKPGLSTEKASQKPGRETGKQHGLASPRRPFLDLRWGGLQCQTLRPKPLTCVGVIFSVKRCIQNLLKKGFVAFCLLWLTASGRAPPGRQGSADFYVLLVF